MPYIGRELDSGNYLKLDDISSSFNGSTTTFNLTAAGKAFFPGSAFSILVNLAGVAQEPESAYQINNATITFATAPVAGDQFFCIVLGVAHGVNVPGNGTVNGAQLAKPFNYDGYFYLDEANNRVGVGTATPAKPLHVVGEGQFDSVRVLGDLTIDGTTTTLDTVVTEVDKLEVGANNSTVGVAITQSGSGDILNLYDGSSSVFSVADGGTVTASGDISIADKIVHTGDTDTAIRFPAANTFSVETSGSERLRITGAGNIGIGDNSPSERLEVRDTGNTTIRIHNEDDSEATVYFHNTGSYDRKIVAANADMIFYGGSGAGTEHVRIKSTGAVGIGTADPQSQFEVYGSSPIVRSKHSTSQKYTQINHNGTDGYVDWSSGNLILRGASDVERMRINSSGNVGIGTDNPFGKLQVHAGNDANFSFSTGGGEASLEILNDAGSANVPLNVRASEYKFKIQGNEKVRITSTGDIGIGVTNPTSFGPTLQVAGTDPALLLQDTATAVDYFGMNIASGAVNTWYDDASSFVIHTASALSGAGLVERLRITSAGSVGIGNNNPLYKLSVLTSGTTDTSLHLATSGGASDNGDATNSIRFTGGTNTRWANAKYEAFAHIFHGNGAERLRIDSGGRVLQGLTSAKFGFFNDNNAPPVHQIQGDTYYDTAFSIFRDGSGGSGPNFILAKGRGAIVQDNDILGTISFQGHDGTTELIEGAKIFAEVGGTPGSNTMPTDLVFNTNSGTSTSSERLRITSGGLVGINNDSPATVLDIKSTKNGDGLTVTKGSNVSAFLGHNGSGDEGLLLLKEGGATKVLLYAETNQNSYINSGGNLGINTTAPNADLTVGPVNSPTFNRGAVAIKAVQDSNSLPANIYLEELSGAEGYTLSIDSNGDLNFHNSGAAAPTITFSDDNNVGINEANPSVSLDLSSNTDAVSLPTGTTAQRPSGTDAYIRKNSTNNALEFYNGTNWVEIITDYFPTGSTTLG